MPFGISGAIYTEGTFEIVRMFYIYEYATPAQEGPRPAGTPENSPAFQRWASRRKEPLAPEGRQNDLFSSRIGSSRSKPL